MCFLRLLRVFVPCRQKRADIARVIPCENNFCTKYAHHLHFCGLQKLNTLNLRLFHPPLNPRNHFSTVLIETNWYTMICKYIDCSSLTSVEIPSSVEYIYYAAFSNCRSLTSVTIPSSVKDIGSYAFNGPKLSTIVSLIEDPSPIVIVGKGQIWSTFSDDTFTKATLYVPAGSVEKYKTTYGWKDFGHIVPLDEGMSVKVMESDNDSPSEYFLLNGQQVDQPQKGLTIVKTGKKAVKVLVK